MGKASEGGSKKLDQAAQKNYKEFGKEQAMAAPIVPKAQQPVKDLTLQEHLKQQKQESASFGNWRKGDFGESKKKQVGMQ